MDWVRQIPIGQFVDVAPGWLRRLDPRLKMAWSLLFLLTPILAGPLWRLALVLALIVLTACSGLPARVWFRSLALLLVAATLIGALAAFLPVSEVGAGVLQRPPAELRLVPSPRGPSGPAEPPPTRSGLAWELVRWGPLMVGPVPVGPLVITRRSADLGLNGATLLVTVIQSTNLMLLTTPPEELVWALNWGLAPLRIVGLPVERLGFTLLLALRFLPLVQEELQNLLRSLATRSVSARQLGRRGVLALVLAVAERLFRNVLLRAEQGAEALIARGARPLPPAQLQPPGPIEVWSHALATIALVLALVLRWKVGAL